MVNTQAFQSFTVQIYRYDVRGNLTLRGSLNKASSRYSAMKSGALGFLTCYHMVPQACLRLFPCLNLIYQENSSCCTLCNVRCKCNGMSPYKCLLTCNGRKVQCGILSLVTVVKGEIGNDNLISIFLFLFYINHFHH